MPHLRLRAATVLTVTALLGLTACSGSKSTEPSSAASTEAPQPSESAIPEEGSMGTFTMTTADGLEITGAATACDNPLESSVMVNFAGESSTVTVDAENGTGIVTVSGDVEFEGRVESVSVGDAGDLVVTGSGSLADPGAAPTTFEIVGTCP